MIKARRLRHVCFSTPDPARQAEYYQSIVGLGLVARDIDDRDVPRANLVLGQLRARNLPIPAAIFAEKLVRALEAMRAKPGASGASTAAAASGRA